MLQHQPQHDRQEEEADAAPLSRKEQKAKMRREVRTPKAEIMLYAEQEQSQRWRAQAMHLEQELSVALQRSAEPARRLSSAPRDSAQALSRGRRSAHAPAG